MRPQPPWLQVALALAIVAALMVFAVNITKHESLADSGLTVRGKRDILLVKAGVSTPTNIGTTAHTHTSKADTVIDLPASRDRAGGDQFSLSFRLHVLNPDARTSRCLLLWGDQNYVTFKAVGGRSARGVASMEHLLVFMPMVWLETVPDPQTGRLVRKVHVYFNTNNKVLNVCTGVLQERLHDISRHGSLITVTFTDYSVNLVSKGCVCTLYENMDLIGTASVEHDTIRRNAGLLYVLPSPDTVPSIRKFGRRAPRAPDDDGDAPIKVSDLSYHNYELGAAEITKKQRGDLRYDPVKAKEAPSSVYDVTQDLAYHQLTTPAYA